MEQALTAETVTPKIQVGVKYETEWPETSGFRYPRIWFPGKATNEIIVDGLDLAILHTSLEDGRRIVFHLEDIKTKDLYKKNILPGDTSGIGEVSFEQNLFAYIEHHRISYGSDIFLKRGLQAINHSGRDCSEDLVKEMFAIRESKTNMAFSYISFKWRHSQWDLKLNGGDSLYRSAAWNDLEGLSNLAELVYANPKNIEVGFALENSAKANKRIKILSRYKDNKKFIIGDSELAKVKEELEAYVSEDFSQKHLKWNLYFKPAIVCYKTRYLAYNVGLIAYLEPKSGITCSEEEHVIIQKEVIDSLEAILSHYQMGIASNESKSYNPYRNSLLLTKYSGSLSENKDRLDNLIQSFDDYFLL